jgi:hypothetical protein
MANKTIRVSLLQNANLPSSWTSCDTDFKITNNGSDTIIKSDVDTTLSISGDNVYQKVVDVDITQDIVFNAKSYMVTQDGAGYTGEYVVTITGSSDISNPRNISCKYKEVGDSVLAEQAFEDNTGPTTPYIEFSVNGTLKQTHSPQTLGVWNDLGTHTKTWNGTDTIICLTEVFQHHIEDSTINTGLRIKFEIEG